MPHRFKMHLPHFSLQLRWKRGEELHKNVPKGCLALCVGQRQEQQRCVIPVEYINHPLFQKLLEEAEEEYGFEHKGRIAIPCNVSHFQYVQEVIQRESHHHGSHPHPHLTCFGQYS
ncbi:hypothetical protein SUGI_0932670 [Cryptomeria japonica]|nr:hypothetical protein SUGI_0932670 [Cryptomeria japonica]